MNKYSIGDVVTFDLFTIKYTGYIVDMDTNYKYILWNYSSSNNLDLFSIYISPNGGLFHDKFEHSFILLRVISNKKESEEYPDICEWE